MRRRGTYQRNDNESHRVKNHLGICGHSEVYDGFVRRRGTYYTNNIILIWKHITPSHCSVMEACRQRLEDVDRNHTMTHNHRGAEDTCLLRFRPRLAHNQKDG